jgi:hypothetical protein
MARIPLTPENARVGLQLRPVEAIIDIHAHDTAPRVDKNTVFTIIEVSVKRTFVKIEFENAMGMPDEGSIQLGGFNLYTLKLDPLSSEQKSTINKLLEGFPHGV